MSNKLFVSNLAYHTTEDDLTTFFGQAGEVFSANVVIDLDTGHSRGFAFIEMATQAEAQRAIQSLNGKDLNGRELRVAEAQDRPRNNRRGGSGGGGGGGNRRRSNDRRGGGGGGGGGRGRY